MAAEEEAETDEFRNVVSLCVEEHLLVFVDNSVYRSRICLHFLEVQSDFGGNLSHVFVIQIYFVAKPFDGTLVLIEFYILQAKFAFLQVDGSFFIRHTISVRSAVT